jgi:hypothetical protein
LVKARELTTGWLLLIVAVLAVSAIVHLDQRDPPIQSQAIGLAATAAPSNPAPLSLHW